MRRHLPFLLTILALLPLTAPGAQETATPPDHSAASSWEAIWATAPGEGPVNQDYARYARLHEQYVKATPTDQGAVVFLGDSITFHFDLKKAFPDLATANRGISGDTTRGMLYRLPDEVLDLHPRLIVLLGGVNDLSEAMAGHGGTVQTLAGNVRLMLERISRRCPGVPVLVLEILPARKRNLPEANAAVAAVVADFPQARRFPSYRLFLKPDGTQDLALYKDPTHPNADGYRVLAEALAPELKRLLAATPKP